MIVIQVIRNKLVEELYPSYRGQVFTRESCLNLTIVDNLSLNRYPVEDVSFPAPFWCSLLSATMVIERRHLARSFKSQGAFHTLSEFVSERSEA